MVSSLERKEERVFVVLAFAVLLLSPPSFCSCSELPVGLTEGEAVQLHVGLLAGAGHVTTSCELPSHLPRGFGQGRLLPASHLPSRS